MIKLCGKTIVIPLKLIFRSLLEEGVFPDDWKKKECSFNPQKRLDLIKNYRPISFLKDF